MVNAYAELVLRCIKPQVAFKKFIIVNKKSLIISKIDFRQAADRA